MRTTYRRWEDEARESWRVPGGDAQVVWSFMGQRVRHDDGTFAPRQFTYIERPDDERLPMYLIECSHTDEGVPIVEAVHVVYRPPRGRDVRVSDLRHLRPLEDVVEEAFSRAARPWQELGDLSVEDLRTVEDGRDEMRRTVRGLRSQARRKVTPDLLAEVARVYRDNLASGAPTKAVGDHFHIAPSTASLYVKRARDAGSDMGEKD